jgi:hypothetical protein
MSRRGLDYMENMIITLSSHRILKGVVGAITRIILSRSQVDRT